MRPKHNPTIVMHTAKLILGWAVFVALLLTAIALDDTCEVRKIEVLPEPPSHSGKVNYGKP